MQLAAQEGLVPQSGSTHVLTTAIPRTPGELANIVSEFASSDGWMDRVRLRIESRWYERLYHAPDYDIWVISWMPGQSTGFHDHGESSGAFVVATGVLEEHRPGASPLVIHPDHPRAFGSDYAHDVRNSSQAPAVSIHAYSPALSEMNEYELEGSLLVPRERASERAQALEDQTYNQQWTSPRLESASPTGTLGIDEMLATARAQLRRLSPIQAHEAVTNSEAILVDIRPEAQRAIEGAIPGALIVERNVLEWRLDPTSSARLPVATDHDLEVIVFCSEGYTSSLAAAALKQLGLWRATDIIGGFHGWRSAGLAIVPPGKESESHLQ